MPSQYLDTGGYCRYRLLLALAVVADTGGYCSRRGLLQIQGVIANTVGCWRRGLLLSLALSALMSLTRWKLKFDFAIDKVKAQSFFDIHSHLQFPFCYFQTNKGIRWLIHTRIGFFPTYHGVHLPIFGFVTISTTNSQDSCWPLCLILPHLTLLYLLCLHLLLLHPAHMDPTGVKLSLKN